MTLSEIAATLTGERMMTKYTGGARSARHGTRSLGSLTTSTRRAGGGMARMSMTGCPPSGNSRVTIGSRQPSARELPGAMSSCRPFATVTSQCVARS